MFWNLWTLKIYDYTNRRLVIFFNVLIICMILKYVMKKNGKSKS